MKIITKLILESFRFAWNALKMNMLRTILSLLGVTIGIFAIISVFTLVDSLERSLKESFNFLGANTILVQKWPWGLGGDETLSLVEIFKTSTSHMGRIRVFSRKRPKCSKFMHHGQ